MEHDPSSGDSISVVASLRSVEMELSRELGFGSRRGDLAASPTDK
jgi:hypothetical protein